MQLERGARLDRAEQEAHSNVCISIVFALPLVAIGRCCAGVGACPAPAWRVLLYVVLLCLPPVAARGLSLHVVVSCILLINCI